MGVLITIGILPLVLLLPSLWESLIELNNTASRLSVAAALLIFVLLFLLLGITLILHPLYCRLTVTSEGLEYRVFFGNLKSSWVDLYKVNVPTPTYQPGAVVLASRKPQVHLHGWTRILPWNIGKGFISNGIHLSQFGKMPGSPLEADLYTFAPQLKENLQASQPQPKPQQTTIKSILVYVWFFVLIILCEFVVAGQSETLICERPSRGGQVDCSIKRTWYWTIPLGKVEALDVRGARLMEYYDSEGSSYQIVLQTTAGNVSLNWIPMGGKGMGDQIAQAIDKFVQDPSRPRYEQRVGTREGVGKVFAVMVVITILSGFWLFWPKRRKADGINL